MSEAAPVKVRVAFWTKFLESTANRTEHGYRYPVDIRRKCCSDKRYAGRSSKFFVWSLFLVLVAALTCNPAAADGPAIPEDDEEGNNVGIVSNTIQVPGPLQHVVAVTRNKAELPCDVTPPLRSDQVTLVLWYKDDGAPSIYTFDARDKLSSNPKHWSEEMVLGRRAYFRTATEPASLSIDNVKEEDAGLYRCRVDFRKSPTRNLRVNLTVIVPPKQPKIFDEQGHEVGEVVGPYDEDATLTLMCFVQGGHPTPEVSWWQEQRLIDRTAEVQTTEGVQNWLRLTRLGRPDLKSSLSCQASNTNLSLPASRSVLVELNLRPLDIRILSSRQPLSANRKYEVTCQAVGSRPPAVVTWWKEGELLKRAQETLFDGGNVTLSLLSLIPSPEDDGKRLVCRAENPAMAGAVLEDTWILEVYHVPQVHISLGRNLNPSNIREGVDVYFDCHVIAKPTAFRVMWRHEGILLQHNVSSGVIISDSSLVLQRVSRASAGRYTCHASNSEGEGASPPFQLGILHKPVCRQGQVAVYGGAKGHTTEILCQVDAQPPARSFRWSFNGTGDLVDVSGTQRTSADGRSSTLRYVPRMELDFGTLLCWGSNPLGEQLEPCVFHVDPAGIPDPPSNCTISNHTLVSLEVECTEGFDGGLPQYFALEVFDAKNKHLLANLTSSSPLFTLFFSGVALVSNHGKQQTTKKYELQDLARELEHADGKLKDKDMANPKSRTSYGAKNNYGGSKTPQQRDRDESLRSDMQVDSLSSSSSSASVHVGSVAVIPAVGTMLKLRAVNARGSSEPVMLETTGTVGLPAEKQTGSPHAFQFTPTLGILLGIVGTGVLLVAGVLVGLKMRSRRQKAEATASAACEADLKQRAKADGSSDLEDGFTPLADKDPDLIMQDRGDSILPVNVTDNPLHFLHGNIVGIRPGIGDPLGSRSSASGSRPRQMDSIERINNRRNNLSPKSEIMYAELSVVRPGQSHPSGTLHRAPPDPTIYAQIDHGRKLRFAEDFELQPAPLPMLHMPLLEGYQETKT